MQWMMQFLQSDKRWRFKWLRKLKTFTDID